MRFLLIFCFLCISRTAGAGLIDFDSASREVVVEVQTPSESFGVPEFLPTGSTETFLSGELLENDDAFLLLDNVNSVPEPSAFFMSALALAIVAMIARRFRRPKSSRPKSCQPAPADE